MISLERWQAAQDAERAFHANGDLEHIAHEVRSGARAMMRLDDNVIGLGNGKSVLDVGCGPHSLLLDFDTSARGLHDCVALDPLHFGDGVERRYTIAKIERAIMPAEDYPAKADRYFDEVWCYNCLQHVRSVEAVLALCAVIAPRVRLFEWLDVPETVNHPHVLTLDDLREPFKSWRVRSEIVGTWRTPDFAQRFVALVVDVD